MTTLPLDVLFKDNGAARGLAATGKAADSAAKSINQLSMASAKLSAAERKAADAAGAMRLAEIKLQEVRNRSKSTATQIAAAEENLARASRRHAAAQNEVKVASERVTTAQARVKTAMQQSAHEAEQAGGRFRRAAGGLRTIGSVGVSATGKLVGGLRTVGIGAAGVAVGLGAATAGVVGFGLKVASANEQAKISFTTMLGSARKAEAFLVKLQAFAAKTPFEFPELQKAASSLISVGISAKNVIPIMTTLGNVTSGMGTGAEGVQRATIALQQMSASGRITAEDLNQLRDAGLPLNMVFKAISAQTGESTKKLMGMYQAGKLGRKELDALMASLASGKGFERFNGLMDKQSKSLAGMLSTLKDTFGQGLAKSLQAGMPFIKGAIGSVSKAMQTFFNNSQTHSADMVSGLIGIGNAVLGIGIAFVTMAQQALTALSSIGNLWDGLDRIQQGALKKLGFDGSGLSAMGKAAGDAANILGNQLLPKLTAAQEKWVAFGKDQEAKAALRDSIQRTTNAIQGLGNAVDGSQIKLKHWSDRSKLSAVNQEQLKNRIHNVKSALKDQLAALSANGASHKVLAKATDNAKSALAREFRQMGLSKREAGALARQILGIPKKHDTKIKADSSGAKAGARSAQRYINGVHGKTVQIKVHWTSSGVSTNAPGGGLRKFEAHGGLIRRATGGGVVPGNSPHIRADNIPAALTAGEFVHQVPAVRFWGGGFMGAVNRMDRSTVRRIVNGGGGGGQTVVINLNAPNYIGSRQELVQTLTDLKRQGRLDVVLR